jgi:putative addiction module killer protein
MVQLARSNRRCKGGETLERLGEGNLSSVKSVGHGVLECRINYGPGYRIYFGRDGNILVILLTGFTKRRQQREIAVATERWGDYRQRKRQ